jgi:hypothetical protein
MWIYLFATFFENPTPEYFTIQLDNFHRDKTMRTSDIVFTHCIGCCIIYLLQPIYIFMHTVLQKTHFSRIERIAGANSAGDDWIFRNGMTENERIAGVNSVGDDRILRSATKENKKSGERLH